MVSSLNISEHRWWYVDNWCLFQVEYTSIGTCWYVVHCQLVYYQGLLTVIQVHESTWSTRVCWWYCCLIEGQCILNCPWNVEGSSYVISLAISYNLSCSTQLPIMVVYPESTTIISLIMVKCDWTHGHCAIIAVYWTSINSTIVLVLWTTIW